MDSTTTQGEQGTTATVEAPAPEAPKANRRKGGTRKAEQQPLHSNPKIAKALAAGDKDKFSSMEAWGQSHGLSKSERRQARQVLRDAGLGVGRGNRYQDSTTTKVRRAAEANARAARKQAQAAKLPR